MLSGGFPFFSFPLCAEAEAGRGTQEEAEARGIGRSHAHVWTGVPGRAGGFGNPENGRPPARAGGGVPSSDRQLGVGTKQKL